MQQLRSHITSREAAQSNNTSELHASDCARLVWPPRAGRSGIRFPAWSLVLTPRGTAGPRGASLLAGPQRWLVRGPSKKPSTPAQLLPTLPAPDLLASSFPPIFQGAAEGGAGMATSLICAVLEGHSRGSGECQFPATVTVPAGLAGTAVRSQAQRGLGILPSPQHPLSSHHGSIAPHQSAWQHPLSPSQGPHLQGKCFVSPRQSPPHST